MTLGVIASGSSGEFVDLDVPNWAWLATIGVIVALLLFDILILNRHAHAPTFRRAAIETVAWVAIGITFGVVVIASFGGTAGGEYFSGYLIEYSLSIDNVFVWALILAYFKIPAQYQRRVLFWGVFGALVLGQRSSSPVLGDHPLRVDAVSRRISALHRGRCCLPDSAVERRRSFLKVFHRSADHPNCTGRDVLAHDGKDWRRRFSRCASRQATDVLFGSTRSGGVCCSKEQFIVFTSNAFAIMACGRCTSCSPTCMRDSVTFSRAWRSSLRSWASR